MKTKLCTVILVLSIASICLAHETRKVEDKTKNSNWVNAVLNFYKEESKNSVIPSKESIDVLTNGLAYDWKKFSIIAIKMQRDLEFKEFILLRINGTANKNELLQIEKNIKKLCPSRHKEMCKKLSIKINLAFCDSMLPCLEK